MEILSLSDLVRSISVFDDSVLPFFEAGDSLGTLNHVVFGFSSYSNEFHLSFFLGAFQVNYYSGQFASLALFSASMCSLISVILSAIQNPPVLEADQIDLFDSEVA